MILYTATWCSKCKLIKPFVSSKVLIENIDTWSEHEIERIGLKGLPTLQTDDGAMHAIVSVKDLEKWGAKK